MKQVLFAIFAHPDDESFGPSGTLTLLAQSGWEVHVICVTDGNNNDVSDQTKAIRKEELERACELMGAESVQMIGFPDGSLNNLCYHEVASSLRSIITRILEDKKLRPAKISFLTFEPHGLTGHLDHIAVSMIVTYIYTTLDTWLQGVKSGWLKYYCLCDEQKAEDRSYFVYSPKGYREEDIDETVDISDILDQKKQIILAHASQDDAKRLLELGDHLLSREHFLHYK